jgi:hypothetical protein
MLRSRALLWLLLLLCGAPLSAADEPVDDENLRYQLLDTLLASASRPLPSTGSCDFKGPEKRPGTLTIGRWVAWNLQYMQPGQANSIKASCHPIKGLRATCDLQFNADSQGESPWACGFRFDVKLPSYQLVPATLTCIGTC